ncbi:hypothetical protein CF062_10880 [Clostridium botulinum]
MRKFRTFILPRFALIYTQGGEQHMTRLREAREKVGLRRNFVANKLEISPDHLNLIERGKTPLNLIRTEILANLYNISFEEMAKIALDTLKGGK